MDIKNYSKRQLEYELEYTIMKSERLIIKTCELPKNDNKGFNSTLIPVDNLQASNRFGYRLIKGFNLLNK